MAIDGEARRNAELGPLEAAVMNALWHAPDPLDVEAIHARVAPEGRPVRNTVQSTLERLVRKGLVSRSKHGRAYRYAARVARREWFAGAFGALADALRSQPGSDLLAGFVDFAERADPEALATLQQLVHERLGDRDEGPNATPPSRERTAEATPPSRGRTAAATPPSRRRTEEER